MSLTETDRRLIDGLRAGVCIGPGPCDTTPIGEGHNWVTEVNGLPLYIRAIAQALLRSGHSESEAVQLAVGTVKRWAAGGGKVTAATRARAAKAVSEWEAKKAAAHGSRSDDDGRRNWAEWDAAHPWHGHGAHEPAEWRVSHHESMFLGHTQHETDIRSETHHYHAQINEHHGRNPTLVISRDTKHGSLGGEGGKIKTIMSRDVPSVEAGKAAAEARIKADIASPSKGRRDMAPLTESSSAGGLLPKGLSPKQAAQVVASEMHAFRGRDLAHCAVCGLPASAPIHLSKRAALPKV